MAENKQQQSNHNQRNNKTRRSTIFDTLNNFRKSIFNRKNTTTNNNTVSIMSQSSVNNKVAAATNGSNQHQNNTASQQQNAQSHEGGSKREPKIYTASCNTHSDKIMSDGGGAAPATTRPPSVAATATTPSPATTSTPNAVDTSASKQEASGSQPQAPKQPQTAFDSAAALLAQYGYGLGEQLGKGSYAIVRAATSKKHKRRVAIKIISKKKAPEDYLTKFLPREIQVLKRLRHPNCISLLEAIETNTRIYLIMNLAENGDLLEYIRERGPMPDDDARRYFRHLITGLSSFNNMYAEDLQPFVKVSENSLFLEF